MKCAAADEACEAGKRCYVDCFKSYYPKCPVNVQDGPGPDDPDADKLCVEMLTGAIHDAVDSNSRTPFPMVCIEACNSMLPCVRDP